MNTEILPSKPNAYDKKNRSAMNTPASVMEPGKSSPEPEVILEVENISKSFPGVKALG